MALEKNVKVPMPEHGVGKRRMGDKVEFDTLSGRLTVVRKGNLYEMDFPTYARKEVPVTSAMEDTFGGSSDESCFGT